MRIDRTSTCNRTRTPPWSAQRRAAALVVVGTLSTTMTACGGPSSGGGADPKAAALPQGGAAVTLDPADFTVHVTNRYWPMKKGDRWVYEERDEQGTLTHDEVTVADRTETIDGIEALVVHDVATQDGATVEDTLDFYAQDADGNVWYLGERTAEYAGGRVTSTAGSWEAGVHDAQPGVLLPAHPQPGSGYRQEYLKGEAEDEGFVLSTDEQVQVPTGRYTGALLTRDTSALEPDLVELKWYVPGVGPVLTLTPSGEQTREQLVQAPG